MALKIETPTPVTAVVIDGVTFTDLVADRRLLLTKDDRIAEEHSMDGVKLLAGVGGVIVAAEVVRLKLSMVGGKIEQEGTKTAAGSEPEPWPGAPHPDMPPSVP